MSVHFDSNKMNTLFVPQFLASDDLPQRLVECGLVAAHVSPVGADPCDGLHVVEFVALVPVRQIVRVPSQIAEALKGAHDEIVLLEAVWIFDVCEGIVDVSTRDPEEAAHVQPVLSPSAEFVLDVRVDGAEHSSQAGSFRRRVWYGQGQVVEDSDDWAKSGISRCFTSRYRVIESLTVDGRGLHRQRVSDKETNGIDSHLLLFCWVGKNPQGGRHVLSLFDVSIAQHTG